MSVWAVRGAMIGAGVAIAAGLVFRFWNTAAYPLWLDEAYSAFAADHGFHFLWHVVPRYETHPPFYYSLLHVWGMATGESVGARRALGLLFGLATIPVAGLAAAAAGRLAGLKLADRRWLASLVLALTALHPLLINMSRQVRPYPVMALVYAVATLALLRLAEDTAKGTRPARGWIVGFFVSQALMLWLHNLGVLYATALSLALLVAVLRRGMTRADWAWLLIGQLLVAIVYLPAFLIALSQAGEWARSTWLHFQWDDLPSEFGLIYITWNLWARIAGSIAAGLGVALLVRSAAGTRAAAILLLLGLLPTVLSVAISALAAPVFLDRTLTPTAVPGLLLIAIGLSWPGRWRLLATPMFALLLVSALSIDTYFVRQGPIQDWYRAIDWLGPRMKPGDIVWAYPNEGALPLDYALKDRNAEIPVRQIPADVPAFNVGGYYPTGSRGTVSLYPAEIAALMAKPATKAPPTIWLLRLNLADYDPGDRMLHALEASRAPVDHFSAGRIDITGLRRKDLPAVAAAQQP